MENIKALYSKYPRSFSLLVMFVALVSLPLFIGASMQTQITRQQAQIITPSPTPPVISPTATPTPLNLSQPQVPR